MRSMHARAAAAKELSDAPAKEIARLQGIVLEAVINGGALPGSSQPIRFPDLGFVRREPKTLLKETNLAEGFTMPTGLASVRIVSQPEIEAEATARGEVAFLEFSALQVSREKINFTLEARIAKPSGNATLGLSSVHAEFRKLNGKWVAADPVFSAA